MSNDLMVVPGSEISDIISSSRSQIVDVIKDTYLLHFDGGTNNPDSYFLRFPDKPEARIIALPAAIRSKNSMAGIKWIASYPRNVEQNMQRASAVLILNDYESGYPIACLEASQISSARTAASAALAAVSVFPDTSKVQKIAIVGAGLIARTIVEFLQATGFSPKEVSVFDKDPGSASRLSSFCAENLGCEAGSAETLEAACDGAELVVLATTAAEPYINDVSTFKAGQVVLNISLRDISPEIILKAYNFFDDIEHCMKANTSPHLAEQKVGNRNFAHATIAEVVSKSKIPDHDKPIIFSPFGLGVLDIALGQMILNECIDRDTVTTVPGFLPPMARW